MAHSNSIKRKTPLEDDGVVDYSLAFAYEDNNNRLQMTERSMIKGIVDILFKSSKEVKQWQTDCHGTIKKNKKLTQYKNMWDMLDAAVSSVNVYTDDSDEKIENLESIEHLISNQKNHESLKKRIEDVQEPVKELTRKVANLKLQETRLRSGSWLNRLRNTVILTRQMNRTEKLKDVSTSIKKNKKLLGTKTSNTKQRLSKIIERNKTAEFKRTRLMKNRLTSFAQSFGELSDEFNDALADYNPKADLSKWGHPILREVSEESDNESSDDEETSDIENYSRQQSIKSQSSENGKRGKKINPPFKSFKSLPAENRSSDKKNSRVSRPSDLYHLSTKRHESQESFESIGAEVEEINKTE